MRSKIIIVIAIGVLLIAYSCKKETTGGKLNSVFSYSVSGFVVTFTNFTDFNNYTGPYATYSWKFGDGDTSTVTSPSHIYTSVGKYVVTLTATKGKEVNSFFDTVDVIGPHIVIDGDFSDWEHVGYAYISPDSTSGSTLRAVKAFASGDSVYFYLEGTPQMLQFATNMFFNTDNNSQTGYTTGEYSAGAGADYLYEGDLYYWGTISNYTGSGTDWTWNQTSAFGLGATFSKIGEVPNGHSAIEYSFAKSVLGNVKDSLGFAIDDLNSGFTAISSIPLSNQDTSRFIKIGL